jgi:protein CpxP
MKKLLTVFAVTFVAAVWMIGSWIFFDTMAVNAQGSGTPAVADVDKGTHPEQFKHKGGPDHGFLKKLNLTDAQKEQVKAIRAEEGPKMKPLMQQLKAGRDQLEALRKSGTFDEAKVRAIAKGQADTLTDMIVVKECMMSRIYGVLTPEQRAKAEEMRDSKHGKRHEKTD